MSDADEEQNDEVNEFDEAPGVEEWIADESEAVSDGPDDTSLKDVDD